MNRPRTANRVALLHGFTQTHRSWRPVIASLRRRCPSLLDDVVAPDLPGHGNDPDGTADLWECAERAAARAGRAVYVGYSMGGRVALHCALAHPDEVTGLVLISATAGIDDEAERAERRRADESLADRIEAVGVDAFLDEWLAQPMFAGVPGDGDDRAHRRDNTAAGLAGSLRHAGTGAQSPLWHRLGEITVPTLVVAGERDDKFTGLARRLAEGIPGSALAVIPGAGHNLVLEAPDALAGTLCDWFAAVSATSAPHPRRG